MFQVNENTRLIHMKLHFGSVKVGSDSSGVICGCVRQVSLDKLLLCSISRLKRVLFPAMCKVQLVNRFLYAKKLNYCWDWS